MNLRRYFCCICDYYEKKRIKQIYVSLSCIDEDKGEIYLEEV